MTVKWLKYGKKDWTPEVKYGITDRTLVQERFQVTRNFIMNQITVDTYELAASAAIKLNSFYWYFSPSGYTVGYFE